MKLREWAEKQGISYRTALRWFHGGTLPVEAEQMATGTIIAKLETILGDQIVDHSEAKDDLIRDMTEVLRSFCARLYGKRAARHKAEKAIRATQDE